MSFFSIVPQKSQYILQRFGKFNKILEPGLNFYIPFVDKIHQKICLKENVINIDDQKAITKDNVAMDLNGSLFYKINDSYKASYYIENYYNAIKLLAMTTMRSEVGKIKFDDLFEFRAELNENIKISLNDSCNIWGMECLRYEILKIEPPYEIKEKMQLEAEAERMKRRDIILSEGKRRSMILISEGYKLSEILKAEGKSESLIIKSEMEKNGLEVIEKELNTLTKKDELIKFLTKEKYLNTYKDILKKSNVVVLPENENGNSNSSLDSIALMMSLMNKGKFDINKHDENKEKILELKTKKKEAENKLEEEDKRKKENQKKKKYKLEELLEKSNLNHNHNHYNSDFNQIYQK